MYIYMYIYIYIYIYYIYIYISYRHMFGVLWDVKSLRSCFSKTIYLITMKFTEVM